MMVLFLLAVLNTWEFIFVSKLLSKITLFGENLFRPLSLQSNLGLSWFKVLYEIIRESFLNLKKCVNLSEWLLVILFFPLAYIKLFLEVAILPVT